MSPWHCPQRGARLGRRLVTFVLACVLAQVRVGVPVLADTTVVHAESSVSDGDSDAAYFDGRLVVLDHYRLDGSHSHEYVLLTASEEVLSLTARNQLSGYRTNDAVRVWLAPTSGSATHTHGRRANEANEEEEQSSGFGDGSVRYQVERVQALPKSWLVPGDSATIWGDSTTWDEEDPTLPDRDDGIDDTAAGGGVDTGKASNSVATAKRNSASAARASFPPPRQQSDPNELSTIISQGLQASVMSASVSASAAAINVLPYTRTTKVVSDMSMIVYVLDICGLGGGPATTAEAVSTQIINQTMREYVSACSRDIGYIAPANTNALDVKLGCTGTLSTGDSWTYNSCSGDNLMRLAYAADEYAQSVGVNPRKYRHHVLVLPPGASTWMGPSCNWAGTAVLGFAGPAWTYMWLAGEVWDKPQLYLHEIGHNYMLGHSNRLQGPVTRADPTQEPDTNMLSHGDWTSAMGYCCQMRCFHAPHNWQMGWAQAVAALDSSQLTPGTTLNFFIPPQLSARRNFVTVTTDWVPPPPPSPPSPPSIAPPPTPPPTPYMVTVKAAALTDIDSTTTSCNKQASPGQSQQATEQKQQEQQEEQELEESSSVDYAAYDSEHSSEIVLVSVDGTSSMQNDESGPTGSSASDGGEAVVQTDSYPSPHTFWISWRPAVPPYDMPLPDYNDTLLVHLYDGASQSDALVTVIEARLQPGSNTVWRDVAYGSGLVVRLLEGAPVMGTSSTNGVWVSICRPSHTSESASSGLCHDNLDNDCNGLIDSEDPACQHPSPSPSTFAELHHNSTTNGTNHTQHSPPPSKHQRRRRRRTLSVKP